MSVDGRLRRSAHGRLEFLRTQELLRRFLPAPPARIVDVGGGTGVHAREVAVYGVEGPAWPALDAVGLDRAEALLADAARCARLVETDSAMIAVSAHLLAIAPVPGV